MTGSLPCRMSGRTLRQSAPSSATTVDSARGASLLDEHPKAPAARRRRSAPLTDLRTVRETLARWQSVLLFIAFDPLTSRIPTP
jgi:hypothetical protein